MPLAVRLTKEINGVWVPDPERDEAAKLLVSADSQYLKVAVEDDLGVKIELDQRSAGFQWLVSFLCRVLRGSNGQTRERCLAAG